MNQLPDMACDEKTEIGLRLRAIGKLADRLEAGAEPGYVLDLAKAILASGNQLVQEAD